MVPKYGIEGFVYVRDQNVEVPFEFDADKQELIFGEVKLRMFSRVKVQISIDDSSISGLRQRLSMCLLSPFVPGLSVVKE